MRRPNSTNLPTLGPQLERDRDQRSQNPNHEARAQRTDDLEEPNGRGTSTCTCGIGLFQGVYGMKRVVRMTPHGQMRLVVMKRAM